MKHERISIKWKIFFYLISFLGILLIILWLFQTVYLDVFYKNIKKNELESAKDNIVSIINDDDLESAVNTIAKRYDISILIADNEGNIKYSSGNNVNSVIGSLKSTGLVKLYEDTLANSNNLTLDKKQLAKYLILDEPKNSNEQQNIKHQWYDDGKVNKFDKLPNMPNDKDSESMLDVQIIKNNDNIDYLVVLHSLITPVGATVHTLKIQLVYISIIMIIFSLILALIISKNVSRSIITINNTAKELAVGNFAVEFKGKDYREISELSDTLNITAKQLSKTDVLQKELLANVSHDLRTPLTMITAYSEVMRDLPGENTPENVQVIIDETKRLTYLVNDLLDMSKIQAGVTDLETREYDLTESIESAIVRYSKLLEAYGYIIEFKYENHVMVDADEFKIYQVIYNLISNAVNYTGDDKKVTVIQKEISKQQKKPSSKLYINRNKDKQIDNNSSIKIVRIEVLDSGIGIAKEEIDNVWERYYKIDKNHKRTVMGSGLGLNIVKNILKLHNASYGVESKEGEGSTFWFELPIEEDS